MIINLDDKESFLFLVRQTFFADYRERLNKVTLLIYLKIILKVVMQSDDSKSNKGLRDA